MSNVNHHTSRASQRLTQVSDRASIIIECLLMVASFLALVTWVGSLTCGYEWAIEVYERLAFSVGLLIEVN